LPVKRKSKTQTDWLIIIYVFQGFQGLAGEAKKTQALGDASQNRKQVVIFSLQAQKNGNFSLKKKSLSGITDLALFLS
jgi:hypothetical protein